MINKEQKYNRTKLLNRLFVLRGVFLLSIVCGLWSNAYSQDLHFSQFYNSPLTTNPANTGFIPDADYRVGAHYRNQWSSILTAPYKTVSVFGDAQILRDKFENGWMGVGGLILSDVAGSGSLRSTKVYGSLAYHQMLGEASLLSAGFNIGWANKRIDLSKLTFPSQFNGKFFDQSITANYPSFVATNVSYMDMQAGLNYAYFPDENTYFNVGYSIHHVNRPAETFFAPKGDSSRISMRHIAFVNAILKPNDRVIINPNAYFTTQAKAMEITLGMNANYNLSAAGEMQLIGGLYYRVGDAVIPTLGFEINNIRFAFSYDATTSALRNFNNMQGASEFNIMKKGFYSQYNGDARKVLCPKF
ncbi:PorP/SprF family type IX secretion system membrane protein [Ferruginibacter sp. SUN002]|uniref:PorP/SprF family type IX secretion system membrane protein n=1 Tax=Ferruginibacter sp. SUN002 TaxID=2937789 RepID=UPI003D36B067